MIKEIQGLRGISILLVYLFHLEAEIFSSGFLGVDIFFVISGFVISKTLVENFEKGKKLKHFYISRLIRLYPALLFFVFITMIFYFILSSPSNFIIERINTGLTSLIGVSNLYLLDIQTNYFFDDKTNPFLHTWSLGIEEQFYLFFPFLLFFFLNNRINKANKIIILISIISCLLFFFQGEFFSPINRAWEFLVGSLIFLNRHLISNTNNKVFILLCTILVISIIFVSNIQTKILITTILVSGILWNVGSTNIVNRILKTNNLQVLGNLSYSIYLWHVPSIYFSNIYFGGIDYYFFSTFFTVVFSLFSFYLIENPIRYSKKFRILLNNLFTKKKLISYGVVLFLVLLTIEIKNLKHTILQIQKKTIETLYLDNNYVHKNYSYKEINKLITDQNCEGKNATEIFKSNCFKKNKNKNLIYIFGDSNAGNFTSIREVKSDFDIAVHHFNSSALVVPFFNNFNRYKDVEEKLIDIKDSYDNIYLVLNFNHTLANKNYGKGNHYFKTQSKFYSELRKRVPKNVKIYFIKDTPKYDLTYENCLAIKTIKFKIFNKNLKENSCNSSKNYVFHKMKDTDIFFENLSREMNFEIIDLNSFFCDQSICNFFDKSNQIPLLLDGQHFSSYTSLELSKILMDEINKMHRKN